MLLLLVSLLIGGVVGASCPAACGVCPPPGFSGACCHGNITCETQNWTPEACTPAFGTWCAASPTPVPPTPPPSPTPPPPPTPAPGPKKTVNYLISGLPPPTSLGGTHVILSFLECATPSIPAIGDDSWVKYSLREFANMSSVNRANLVNSLHQHGTFMLASLGGAAAVHSIYSKYDPHAFGVRAARYVIDLGLDGLDVDLEGWGNDPQGTDFLRNLTRGAYDTFKAAGGKQYLLTHAPEMPDFWRNSLYTALLGDKVVFDMIDFVNVQFYNQVPFPTLDHIFEKDIYAPAVNAPTCLQSIAQAIANFSKNAISWQQANSKLLLGFPCNDGSFPVGSQNLNQCNQPQFDAVSYGVSKLSYPLSGVFEWTAAHMAPTELLKWNEQMNVAMKK